MDLCQKRLMYQSTHRGTKEMDLILGQFAQKWLHRLNDQEKYTYANLLAEPDTKLFNWIILNEKTAPAEYQNIIEKINSGLPTPVSEQHPPFF